MSGKKHRPRPTVAELIGEKPMSVRKTCEHQDVTPDGVVSPVCKALSITRQHGWLCSHHSNLVHAKRPVHVKIVRLDVLVITPEEIFSADARDSRASDVDLRLLRVKGTHANLSEAEATDEEGE